MKGIKQEPQSASFVRPGEEGKTSWLDSHESGYAKHLKKRHVQMIALGGAIGTGLFLGAGARLQLAGPALAIIYLVCGVFAFFILRALGELIMHRPSCGSFVSYTREFMGERASFVAGWMYFFVWALTGVVDITAIAIYMKYWGIFADVPQWIFALGALGLVTLMNLVGVKWFGEMEFWFAVIKVAAISIFLIVGSYFFATGHEIAGNVPGLHLITDNGGFFPHGLLPAIIIVQGVVFAYASIELVGTAAGETADARAVVPKAINGVIWRICLFYVGSVFLLVTVLPWTAYSANVSPFVTFFGELGVPGIGSVMNIVVLTAAFSSLNSGLYATGRVLRSLAMGGSAPKMFKSMNSKGVPFIGILVTMAINVFGVLLNFLIPSQLFELLLNLVSLGILSTWGFIVLSQINYRRAVKRGEIEMVSFKMPGAPFTSWLTMVFLFAVLVIIGFDYPNGTYTVLLIPVIAVVLMVGWTKTEHAKAELEARSNEESRQLGA